MHCHNVHLMLVHWNTMTELNTVYCLLCPHSLFLYICLYLLSWSDEISIDSTFTTWIQYRNTLETQHGSAIFRSHNWRNTVRKRRPTGPPLLALQAWLCSYTKSGNSVASGAVLLWGNAMHAGLTSRAEPQYTTRTLVHPRHSYQPHH